VAGPPGRNKGLRGPDPPDPAQAGFPAASGDG